MESELSQAKMLLFITLGLMAIGAIVMIRMMRALSRNEETRHAQVKHLKTEREIGELIASNTARELTIMEIQRELHDNVKSLLTVSIINMDALLPSLSKEQQEKLTLSIEGNEKAMDHIDDLSLALNSDWLKGLGLVNALEQEIEKLRQTGLYEISTRISEHRVAMEPNRELLIFRIVQETVSNIIKHSDAKKILFFIEYGHDHVDFTITDDGKGFDLAASKGKSGRMGMNNMQSRAQLLQGQLKINSAPGEGTTVSLSVPYNINHG